jgi:hypothetical protein
MAATQTSDVVSDANRQNQKSLALAPILNAMFFAASYVRHRGWHPLPRDHGSGPPQNGGPYGPQTGRHRSPLQMPDLCWQHDRVSWTLWTHRPSQTRLSRRLRHKNDQNPEVRLLLLQQTPCQSQQPQNKRGCHEVKRTTQEAPGVRL